MDLLVFTNSLMGEREGGGIPEANVVDVDVVAAAVFEFAVAVVVAVAVVSLVPSHFKLPGVTQSQVFGQLLQRPLLLLLAVPRAFLFLVGPCILRRISKTESGAAAAAAAVVVVVVVV